MNANEGFRQFDAGNTAEAESIFRDAILDGDPDGSGHYGMGLVHLDRGESVKAKAMFLTCIRINPSNAHAHYYLANFSRDAGNPADAAREYRRALEIDPMHSGAKRELSSLGELPAQPTQPIVAPEPSPMPSSQRSTRSASITGNDLYALLRKSEEGVEIEISEHLDKISDIIGTRRRKISAYIGSLSVLVILYIALSVAALAFIGQSVRPRVGYSDDKLFANLELGMIILFFVLLTIVCLVIMSMKISVSRDWLIVKTGLLAENKNQLNLFEASRAQASTHRSLMNRLTDNGALILRGSPLPGKHQPSRLRLYGFFNSVELDQLAEAFRRLSVLQPVNRDTQAAIGLLSNIRSGNN
uniref:tetratricopeptide repeat protein n=1 Tax=uncultured Sphingomonas sp. TaxID=158754 RepID=UPI0035C9CF1F